MPTPAGQATLIGPVPAAAGPSGKAEDNHPVEITSTSLSQMQQPPNPGYDSTITDPPTDLTAALETALRGYISRGTFRNASIGIIIEEKTYYHSLSSSNPKPDPDTIFEIGSITKTFTAIELARLILENRISLDRPIQDFLPADFTMPTYDGAPITVQHVATHTSGLPKDPGDVAESLFDYLDLFNKIAKYSVAKATSYLATYELTRSPGSLFQYSNFFGLLGHALSNIENKAWEEVVIDNVCVPLGMHDTRATLNAAQKARYISGHMPIIGFPTKTRWGSDPLIAPAGALKSSVRDLLKYLAMNLGLAGGEMHNAADLTHKPHFHVKGRVAPISGLVEMLSTAPEMDNVGLAWWINHYHDTTLVGHGGATGGFMSMIQFMPELQCGYVILVDSLNMDMNDVANKMNDVVYSHRKQ